MAQAQTRSEPIDAAGHVETHGKRGVWVPPGLTLEELMIGAAALQERYGMDCYTARSMVSTVISAVRAIGPEASSDNGGRDQKA